VNQNLTRKPDWLKIRPPGGEAFKQVKGLLISSGLNTVCTEAKCPNVAECWGCGTATFMICGDTCTRSCRFCSVQSSRTPDALNPEEPAKVAEAVKTLKLKYVVLTSVDRDDLTDGGAGHFAATIKEIKKINPSVIVESLVPDFSGNKNSVQTVVASYVDVYGHNIETVKALHKKVRDPRADYAQSLETLEKARKHANTIGHKMYTKSGLMVGLGETNSEILEAFKDLRTVGVDLITIGQYLQPSKTKLPVERYWSPEEFKELEKQAKAAGFLHVASGPLVRSSYKASELFSHI